MDFTLQAKIAASICTIADIGTEGVPVSAIYQFLDADMTATAVFINALVTDGMVMLEDHRLYITPKGKAMTSALEEGLLNTLNDVEDKTK